MADETLTGPWYDDDDCFHLTSVVKHRDQLEPEAIIEKLKSANRSLNKFLEAWGHRKIGQGHDLYVYHIPASNMSPAARALFLHIYLDILHTGVLLGDAQPELNFRIRDRAIILSILDELVVHNLVVVERDYTQLYVKDFMVGGALVMIEVKFIGD